MTKTLEDVLKDAASYTDQEATTPTGTDLSTRTAYANRALNEWSDYTDWEDLLSTYSFSVTTDDLKTLSLPTTFRKPMGPLAVYDSSTPTLFEIKPLNDRLKLISSDHYCYLTGDLQQGYTLNVPHGLTSGASVTMDIQSYPSSLLSLCGVIPTRSSDYVTQRIISLVLESRGDDRFPIAKADAEIKLASMAEAQNAKNIGMNNRIKIDTTFCIGES